MGLPAGTVTFLFTDIEGSTRLLRAAGDGYAALLGEHRRIVRDAIARHDGHEVGTEGDSFFVAFARPSDALQTALTAQRELVAHPWPDGRAVRVRMGMHTGEASVISGDYVGLSVHQAARISSAAHGGQVLVSSVTAGLVRDALDPNASLIDIGSHALKDFDEPVGLFQLAHPELPSAFEEPTSIGAFPSNVPSAVTTLVGRDDDLVETHRLLGTSRLLTLTGAGGVGKTSLALELARRAIRGFPDGAWLADLAPISDPDLIAQAVGRSLAISDPEGSATWNERLLEHLGDKVALLVLDNCEHLIAACADLVVDVLRGCPNVRIVATTREAFGLEGEVAWRVPSLEADDAAVRLFIERATDHVPGFTADREVIADICRNLDGIPLAIELAAARTQGLTSEQILARLDDRFALLRGGGRRRVERQLTLRAAVDWSYELLDDAERTVLNRASVFVGGFTLEGAEAVCSGDAVAREDVLELIEGLIRKSLVVFEADPKHGGRYRLLETIRQYALEKLVASGEGTAVRDRHRDVVAAFVEDCERMTAAGSDVEANDRLEAELDNIRAAIDWSPPDDDGEVRLRIIGGMLMYFMPRGLMAEASQRGYAALRAAGGPPSVARLKTCAVTSTASFHQYDISRVAETTDEGIALAAELGPQPGAAMAHTGVLIGRACVRMYRDNDMDGALAGFEEAVEVARRYDDDAAIVWALFNYGSVVHGSDADASVAALEEAVRRARGAGWSTLVLPVLAYTLFSIGDVARARTLAADCLHLARTARYPFGEMRVLGAIGHFAIADGDFELAASSAEEQIAIGRQLGEKIQGLGLGRYRLALASIAVGDYVRATRVLQEATDELTNSSTASYEAPWRLMLGELHEHAGDYPSARSQYTRSLELFRGLADAEGIALCESGLASIDALVGKPSAYRIVSDDEATTEWRRWLPLEHRRALVTDSA